MCAEKKVEMIEAEACIDHVHMLVSRPPHLKYKYGSRHFWCRGYYVDTVGKNKRVIEEYIRNQLSEDEMMDQITMKEYIDPFTGSKNKKA